MKLAHHLYGKIRSTDIFLLLLTIVSFAGIITIYISSERFFYYWDWGGFQWVALSYASDMLLRPLRVLSQIKDSILLEYNHYYVLPLLPLIMAFGKSRLSYILSVAIIYQIPFSLIVGGIACKLIPQRPRTVFWSTVFLLLAMPVALAPTLRAYPDIGAALLICFAILIYIQDTRMGKWWQLLLIGLCIGAAILYRRHYAYGGLAFFAAIALQALIRFATAARLSRGQAWYELLLSGLRVGIIGIITLLCLAILGFPLLVKILTTNYSELYASYALPPGFVLKFYFSNYGWIILPLALLGFVIGAVKGVVDRSVTQTLVLFGGLSFLQWILLVRQVGVHYTLHFTPVIALGLSTFFWTIWSTLKGTLRSLILAGGIGFLVMNTIIVLSAQPINPMFLPFFSYRYPPLFRTDYDQIVELVDYLRSSTPEGTGIYVVDSSSRMNFDLLIKAEQELYQDSKLNVFVTPQIDSRDFYPLELLVKASYLIVSTPVQYHLSNTEEQKVVEVVHRAFSENWEIAEDFVRLPKQFELSDGVILNIYQRRDPISLETSIKTFNRIRKIIQRKPGNQPDWIKLTPSIDSPLSEIGDNSWMIELNILSEIPETGYEMLFADEAPVSGRISGSWKVLNQARCPVLLGLQALDATGRAISINETSTAGRNSSFDLEFNTPAPGLLVFYIREQPGKMNETPCRVKLEWSLLE